MKNIIFTTTFLAIVACLLWSTAFTGVKIGLEYASPLQFAGIRFFIAGLMILPFTGGLKQHLVLLRRHYRFILLIAFLNTFLQYTFFNTGMNMVPAALGAIVIGSGPLFVAMTAHFMMPGDQLSWKKLMIFLLGLTGIILVSFGRNRFASLEEVGILGILILIVVNLISGLGNIFIAKD
ncbi:MAG: DMT family transporter, partial [Bacteroidales bacterium]|nr:DMT family transporter [Bacteroidales bacterium]